MRVTTFSFPTLTGNEITSTQTTTASATLPLNGSLSNIGRLNEPGVAYVPAVTLPGIARTIQVYSTGNIGTSTFAFTGLDIRGVAVATSFAGPTGTAIPTHSTTEFAVVFTASAQTAATSNFTIGFGATGSTNWLHPDAFATPFSMNVSVTTGTSAPILIQDTPDDPNVAAPVNIFTNLTFATVTVSTQAAYTSPVAFVRAIITATTNTATSSASTAASISFLQAGS